MRICAPQDTRLFSMHVMCSTHIIQGLGLQDVYWGRIYIFKVFGNQAPSMDSKVSGLASGASVSGPDKLQARRARRHNRRANAERRLVEACRGHAVWKSQRK